MRYYNDTNRQKVSKILHLLEIVRDFGNLNPRELEFVSKMGARIYQNPNRHPSMNMSEKQAKYLRMIIYKNYRKYEHLVPPLPGGVDFKTEVRRLLNRPDHQAAMKAVEKSVAQALNHWQVEEVKSSKITKLAKIGEVYTFNVVIKMLVQDEGNHVVVIYDQNVGVIFANRKAKVSKLFPEGSDLTSLPPTRNPKEVMRSLADPHEHDWVS